MPPARLSRHCSSPWCPGLQAPVRPQSRDWAVSPVRGHQTQAPDRTESFLLVNPGSGVQPRKRAPARKKREGPTKKTNRAGAGAGSGERGHGAYLLSQRSRGSQVSVGQRLHAAWNGSKEAASFTSSLHGAGGGESGRSSPSGALLSFARALRVSCWFSNGLDILRARLWGEGIKSWAACSSGSSTGFWVLFWLGGWGWAWSLWWGCVPVSPTEFNIFLFLFYPTCRSCSASLRVLLEEMCSICM